MDQPQEKPRMQRRAGIDPGGDGALRDVAIVGMACMFPGAGNLMQFWQNILSKVDAVTDPPPEAWDSDIYYEPGSTANDRVYCKKGGFLGPLAYFDPLAHGVMPTAAQGGEPDQWLALQVARDALADAGYPNGPGNGRQTAVILGKGTYLNRGNLTMVQHGLVVDQMLQAFKRLHPDLTDAELHALRADLKRNLPRFDTETAAAMVPNIVAGRIANRLDLMGPSYTVDAACASSLVALDIAARGLAHGEYDLALVGGMQINTPVPTLTLFCQLNALSAREQIRPFDELADGTLLSEGIGMVVLKRRVDAERDGDRIYAVIKGVGVASDGRAVSVLAPRVEGEELAVRRAFDAAQLDPATVGLVEAHGTATLVGDAVEIQALTRVFGPRRRELPSCAIGSVKSMIGHTMPAAGVAGLIKAALALYHKVLPPTINVERPSPRLEIDKTPFYINSEARPWIHGSTAPRRAGLNAFGFGGINAHVILEEHASSGEPVQSSLEWDSEVCLLRAESRSELVDRARRIQAYLALRPDVRLKDLAFTLNAGIAEPAGSTLAIVAADLADFQRKLGRALDRLADPRCVKIKEASGIYFFEEPLARHGKLAFLFPGEGAQYPNMLAQLCLHFPEVRACFDEMDRLFAGHERGYVVSDLVFPAPAFTDEGRRASEERLWQMDVSVEALYTANSALLRLLTGLGVQPDAILGHSTGEYSAMRAAGMLDERAYELRQRELNEVYERARREGNAPADARLFAVGAAREQVEPIAAELKIGAYVAMDNCPHQVVLATSAQSADQVADALRKRNLLYETLRFDRAYHTPLFESYTLALADALNAWIVAPARVPMYSCTLADRYPDDLEAARRIALEHWVRPVEFRRTIEKMYADGVRLFVEVGPRGNLTAFIDDILAPRPYLAIAANVTRRSDLAQLHHVIALLAAHGVPLQLDLLYRRRAPAVVAFDEQATAETKRKRSTRLKIATGWPSIDLSEETAAQVREALKLRAAGQSNEASPAALSEEKPAATNVTPGAGVPAGEVVGRGESSNPLGDSVPTFAQEGVAGTAPSSPPVALEAYFGAMQRFLDLEQQLLECGLGATDASHAEVETPARYPLIHEIVSWLEGEQLVAICDISLASCPFLRDHTLGREVSVTDPGLTGLPVMPLTMSMEMMAEAASLLTPGLRFVGMREVRAHRWLALEHDSQRVEITATRDPGTDDVYVRVQEANGDEAQGKPIAEGLMKFAAAYPAAPRVTSFALKGAARSQWTPDRLYPEAMFHGPQFRGVASMDRLGENGATATLRVLPRDGLFATGGEPTLVTDPVLLDQPGQVVGFWTVQRLERGFLIFPYRLEALDVYGPPPAAGLDLTCLAHIGLEGEQFVRSDLDVVDRQGRVYARFTAWEDRRFDLPRSVYRFLLAPRDVALSTSWPAALAGVPSPEEMVACRLDWNEFHAEFFTAHGGIWPKVLAAMTLTVREREQWQALRLPPLRRVEWLLGRIAAKDAVRQFLRDHFGLALCPADVEIVPDPNGRPTATGAWVTQVPARPVVSLSHTGGIAVAVVADGNARGNVGVDLEQVGRVTEPVERLAFTNEERELLRAVGSENDGRWPVRLWCAKEAVAKATGEGLVRGPRAFVVSRVDPASGAVHVSLDGRESDAPTTAIAFTACEGNLVVATSLLQA